MQDLVRIVDDVKDILKDEYLRDQDAVWEKPYVVCIEPDNTVVLGRKGDDDIIDGVRDGLARGKVKGIVVGRMAAKYSDTLRDANGNRQILQKAILVTGRMFETAQTYVVITPCHEHTDLRNPLGDTIENAEPKPMVTPNLVTASPDKVDKLITPGGHVGFKSIQFGIEAVFDSRKGDRCLLDPLIDGVMKTPGGAASA